MTARSLSRYGRQFAQWIFFVALGGALLSAATALTHKIEPEFLAAYLGYGVLLFLMSYSILTFRRGRPLVDSQSYSAFCG
jgi:hypothetical protein